MAEIAFKPKYKAPKEKFEDIQKSLQSKDHNMIIDVTVLCSIYEELQKKSIYITAFIAQGGQGMVFEAERNKQLIVVKFIKPKNLKEYQEELKVLGQMKGVPYTCQLIEQFQSEISTIYIQIFKRYQSDLKNVMQYLFKQKETFPLNSIVGIALNISQVLEKVKIMNIFHSDLKPLNILYDSVAKKFHLSSSGIRKKTQIGGLLSLLAISSALIYFFYNLYLFTTNQIQPKFLTQTFVTGEQTDIQLQDNLLAFRFEYQPDKSIEILENKTNSTYVLYASMLDITTENDNEKHSILLNVTQCTEPELIGFKCLDFSQVQNYTLSMNYKKNIFNRIVFGMGTCYQFNIQGMTCASKEETDAIIDQGVFHIKMLTQQYNTTSKSIQINYKNYFINPAANFTVTKTYEVVKQQTSGKKQQKEKKKKKGKECENERNSNQQDNKQEKKESKLCCFPQKQTKKQQKLTKDKQEFNQKGDAKVKSELIQIPTTTQQLYDKNDQQNQTIKQKDPFTLIEGGKNQNKEELPQSFCQDQNFLNQIKLLELKSKQSVGEQQLKKEDQISSYFNSNMSLCHRLSEDEPPQQHKEISNEKEISKTFQIPCFQTYYIDNNNNSFKKKQKYNENTKSFTPNQTHLTNASNLNNQLFNAQMYSSNQNQQIQGLSIPENQNFDVVNQQIKNQESQFLKNEQQDSKNQDNFNSIHNKPIFNTKENLFHVNKDHLAEISPLNIQNEEIQGIAVADKNLGDLKNIDNIESKQNSDDKAQIHIQISKIGQENLIKKGENMEIKQQKLDSVKDNKQQSEQMNILKNNTIQIQQAVKLDQQQLTQNNILQANADSKQKETERFKHLFNGSIQKFIQNNIFKMKLRGKNEYLASSGLDLETKKQIEEFVNEGMDIYKLQKDIMLIKKAIMIIFSCDQLAALKLVGISKYGKNFFFSLF
ncbi:hypothetical protein ABPG74_019262 [Tetrahymena malaccensis]